MSNQTNNNATEASQKQIVYQGVLTKQQCQTAYSYAQKTSAFDSFVDLIAGTSISVAIGTIISGGLGTAIGLAVGLASIFSKYNVMKNALYEGSINNGLNIIFFATGDIAYTVRK